MGIHSVGGASVTVQNSRFEENRNMIWGVISETLAVNEESHVVLKDSIFGSNSEGVSGGRRYRMMAFPFPRFIGC